jgi:phage/plasmid-like protein (TIGR03299 family)
MGHNLFREHMAFVDELPWHHLGKRVSPDVSSHVMLQEAGLDWNVQKVPAPGAAIVPHRYGPTQYKRYFLTRDAVDKEKVAPVLGIVSSRYEVLQNEEAFAFFEPFLEAGHAHYETAGALGNGEKVWVQVRIGDPLIVPPRDEVNRFILLSNSHDGRGALSLRFTPVRVVCNNTLNMAVEGGEYVVNVRHSRNMRDRLEREQVVYLLRLVEATFARAAREFTLLAKTRATETLREVYLTGMLPPTKADKAEGGTPRWWQAVDKALDNPAVTPKPTRDTVWGLYNAVTYVEDYRKTREAAPEARLDRIWFGRGADLKVRALAQAVALCNP